MDSLKCEKIIYYISENQKTRSLINNLRKTLKVCATWWNNNDSIPNFLKVENDCVQQEWNTFYSQNSAFQRITISIYIHIENFLRKERYYSIV